MVTLRNFLQYQRFLITTLLWLVAAPTMALGSDGSNLTPFKADYLAYRFGEDIGTATLALEDLGSSMYSLTYSSKVSKFFLSDRRYEHSIFTHTKGLITPIEYHYKRSGTGPDKKLSAKFSKQAKTISINNDITLDWNNEYDNQLFRIDIPLQLAAGKTSMEYHFINYRGEPRHYQIDVLATEQLELPYGVLDSVKLKINRGSTKRETYAWFSPSLNYTLVRLQQFKEGKEQGDIRLRAFQQNASEISP